jgi:hypothetical protein
MQKRPFLGILLLADKNAKTKSKISTSLGDTVSAHTASESTRLV